MAPALKFSGIFILLGIIGVFYYLLGQPSRPLPPISLFLEPARPPLPPPLLFLKEPEPAAAEPPPPLLPETLPAGIVEPRPAPPPLPPAAARAAVKIQEQSRESQEFIIKIYGNDRAEPASQTIFKGDTVTFVNEDEKLHWPGADPHPTHSSLPSFDALGGISKGQSYSHTFHKAGSYGYHEHLLDNPPALGVITILSK